MKIASTSKRRIAAAAVFAALMTGAAACSVADASGDVDAAGESSIQAASLSLAGDEIWFFDSGVVHDIDIQLDEDAYDAMVATYEADGEKEWIEVTVTIDGTTIENVGLRLKGNSSLFGLTSETATNPEDLPWLLRFDKFVDDQLYQGHGDIVIRSNSTETAMNEAVALELLGLAGLATEEAVATEFTVNGGETELRLAMELPDDAFWVETNFDSDDSLLFKAESTGDYTYRGDDDESYTDVFDQKYGDNDLEPLIDFLEFINNADDETFAAELSERLDVDAFATYLAYQDLIGNGDDIDGRGNNSYLHYDGEAEQFTVVNWDLNLAFSTANVNGGARGTDPSPGAAAPGVAPDAARGADAPGVAPNAAVAGGGRGQAPGVAGQGGVGADGAVAGPPPAAGGDLGGGAGGTNVLSARFLATPVFAELYQDARVSLAESLFDSGTADAIIDTWVETLSADAGDLVDVATIEADADALRSWIEQA